MSKSTQINKRLIAKIPTPGNDTTYLGANSVGATQIQDGSITYEKLDPNASFKNVMQGGFQNFVDTQNVLVATTNTGSPATGFFHSTVVNRKSIVDLTQDLKVRMGIERIPTQIISQLQDEFGPAGQPVYSPVNDINNLIRFVGTWANDNSVQGLSANAAGNSDYVEVTFYGTGLNMLMFRDTGSRTQVVSIDGGADSANVYVAGSAVITARNYNSNAILNLASGLTLGVHTVRIKATSGDMRCYGFEILNESTTLKVNQGSGYSFGKKLTLASQQSPAYNSGFDSGTLGTRGGRVLCYQNSVGNFGRIVNPTNASSALLASADHTNEEMARTYHWREFGAARADDFSNSTSGIARAFTLEDCITSLVSSNSTPTTVGGVEYISISNANATFGVFTFVGTGLDVEIADSASGGSDSYTYQIDGATAVAWPYTSGSTTKRIQKIVSGLPYGSHTFRINRVTAATFNVLFSKFIVYQPKKPTLPSGAIELADHNIMATYTPNTTPGPLVLAPGVLRKEVAVREATYVGTWTISAVDAPNSTAGFNTATLTVATYFEIPFVGTGIEYRFFQTNAGATNFTLSLVNLNGGASIALNTLTTNLYQTGAGLTFTSSTGVVSGTAASNAAGSGISITGLAFGSYKLRVTQNVTTASMYAHEVDIVTPIHSYKSNTYADVMNTLPIGSQGMTDGRKFTPVKESVATKGKWSQAVGVTSAPTTTSTVPVPCPEMSIAVETIAGQDLEIFYRLDTTGNVANDASLSQVYVDEIPVGVACAVTKPTANGSAVTVDSMIIPVSPGVHKIDLYWWTTANTMTAGSNRRIIKGRAV